MEELRRQVTRARRRLILQQFIDFFVWTLFAGLLVAVIGVAIPKIWPINVDAYVWAGSWIAGGILGAAALAGILTYAVRRKAIDAAIEIDRRYGLKERISSTLSLAPQDLESEVGRALVDDASRRVAKIDVRERFGLNMNWRAALPLVPALFVFGLAILDNATQRSTAKAAESKTADQEQVRKANEELKKRIQQKRKQLESDKNVKDAELEMLLKKLEAGIEKINASEDLDRKQAMVELNDLKKEIEERRKQLGDSDEMKKQFNQLKDLKTGPADKIAKAMKDGDFKEAMNQLKQLSDKLANDELTEEEKKQLAEQVGEMKDKLQEMVKAHEQAKQELQEQIRQAEQQGNKAQAEKLKQKLQQMQAQDQQMQQLQDMAQKLGECQQCMKQGDGKGAAAQLAEMMNDLQEMQADLDQLESLDELMDQIADAKNSMNCDNCGGAGCEACMGNGMGQFGMSQQQGFGNGLGAGQGQGDRPEEETDTGAYDSQVRAKPKAGEAVMTGVADGPNRKGLSREAVKQEMESSLREDSDPLSNQPLPRTQREHAKEYFERFRKGGA